MAQPTAVKALEKAGKVGTYLGFIEMENQELAKELFSQIKTEEKEINTQWANGMYYPVYWSFLVGKFFTYLLNLSVPDSLIFVGSRWGQIGAFCSLSRNCARLSDFRM